MLVRTWLKLVNCVEHAKEVHWIVHLYFCAYTRIPHITWTPNYNWKNKTKRNPHIWPAHVGHSNMAAWIKDQTRVADIMVQIKKKRWSWKPCVMHRTIIPLLIRLNYRTGAKKRENAVQDGSVWQDRETGRYMMGKVDCRTAVKYR